MQSDKQKARIEQLKKETAENLEKTFMALKSLSEANNNEYISTTEIACVLFPSSTYGLPIKNDGKSYKQNSEASTVMNWLKRLVEEGKVETQKKFGSRVYRPITGQAKNSTSKK